MNHLLELDHLGNRYFAMRHGHSTANARGIIVSRPENGGTGFGLSERGREQVIQSLRREFRLDAGTLILCSDFRRARESATIAHDHLGSVDPVAVELRLRERNFGDLELAADSAYANVWREDSIDPDGRRRGVESVNQVMSRVTSVIAELEQRYADATLLLVSHGDVLQILQAAFARRAASRHRDLDHLHTAEIRQLEWRPPETSDPAPG